MPNFNIIKVRTVGATEHLPARVIITSERFKQSVRIARDGETGLEDAENYLFHLGFNLVGRAEGTGHMYIITDTFKPIK